MEAERRALKADLLTVFGAGAVAPLPEDRFQDLALRTFRYQYLANSAYGAYCRRRSRTPATVDRWTDIPGVPTAAFKETVLVSGEAPAEAVFRTSGTTRGPTRRGSHAVRDLSLYHGSLLPAFEAFLLPDGARPRMLSLLPEAEHVPDSSLTHMVDVVLRRLGSDGSAHVAGPDGEPDEGALASALRKAEGEGVPVLLLGTSFSFLHWLDGVRRRGERFRLPDGSRLMDTGGYKGRSREVEPAELRQAYGELLGIPAPFCVNEYGMTELCSQYYDTVLRDHVAGGAAEDSGPRTKAAPGWLRTVVVHPETLEPLPAGEIGLLRHLDLANLDSVLAVQTEDVGRAVPGGLELHGRAPQAPPRGCSLAVEDLIASLREADR